MTDYQNSRWQRLLCRAQAGFEAFPRQATILIAGLRLFTPAPTIKIAGQQWPLLDAQLAEALSFAGITEAPVLARRGFEFAIEALVWAKTIEREEDLWPALEGRIAELYPSGRAIALQTISADRHEILEIDSLLLDGELARRIDQLTELLEAR